MGSQFIHVPLLNPGRYILNLSQLVYNNLSNILDVNSPPYYQVESFQNQEIMLLT